MHDIAVYGATGFVGRLVAEYLAAHAPPGVTVALAGRSRAKLERLGLDAPLLVADAEDDAALRELAGSARVIVSTVGPYYPRGLKLVDACVAAGAHYADLTGEVLFVRESLERHAAAEAAGVRIVHSCGFDSIPSDLGVLLLHDAVGDLGDTELVVTRLKGGLSGGTLASMKGQIDAIGADPAKRRIAGDPYALSPHAERRGERDSLRIARDPVHGWTGPFVMATYNTRVVRRSAALLGYGPAFRYREVSRYGNPVTAAAFTGGLVALAGGLAFGPTRKLLDRLLPDPGQGPSEQARREGHFTVEVHGGGRTATIGAQGDPGYAATAVMLGESALALALDELPPRAGVLTPASGIGLPLAPRLRAAGMTVAVA
ncbi:MAG TPA: saccharopine dehydrogenase NADP-binding domain-containing protein [Solirubrobacter sp.]|nr:saccharopine dehydrogenase NADP-binding domain-containing protein [Solirubrobacter sp.]